ncbi:unnamed protein product [Citrullus colocynthis]|uniref:Agglutinin domain-containing protein n=1 Tax=Citrullus colocynthis TaxID=252529 RepID=A0ABP0ZB83_9ROSI
MKLLSAKKLEINERIVPKPVVFRIYDKKVIVVATGFAENRLKQPAILDVKLSYDDTSISTWSSTVSMKLGEKLVSGSVFSGEIEWGEAKNLTKSVETVHKVLVQPLSKNDTLINGQNITLNMEDGIYKGINLYNFQFQTESSQLDVAVSGYAKFQLEQAKIDEPEEDQSKWTCTLFEPVRVNDDGLTIRLRHVQLGHFACLWRVPLPYEACLYAASANHDQSLLDIFSVFDWDSLFILPKHIAFKAGNATGSYLRGKRFQGMNYLTFNGSDISSCAVTNERFADEGINSGLSAIIPTITSKAQLQVYELVATRQIENVVFRLSDARIYFKKVIIVDTGVDENKLNSITIFSFTSSDEIRYIDAVKRDVETSIIKSSIPIIFDDKVVIGLKFSGEYEWGETKNFTKKVEAVHKVLVQPLTKVRVNLVVTQASYDVPFTYTQNDTLFSGQRITMNMEDEIYKGINLYDFKFETEFESLQL